MRSRQEIMRELTEFIEASQTGKTAPISVVDQVMIELLLDIRERL